MSILSTCLLPLGLLAGEDSGGMTIHLRDRLPSIEAARIDFEPGGVRVLSELPEAETIDPESPSESQPEPVNGEEPPDEASIDRGRLIPWDRVRSIDGLEDPALQAAWPDWQALAEDLWRARSRLQRGDRTLSAPLFEQHFERLAAAPDGSELGLIVSEGLLRSRLPSGEVESLLPVALEVVRLRRAGYRTDRFDGMPPILDEEFWLVPQLLPIPTRSDLDSESMRTLLRGWLNDPDPVVAELAQAYSALHDSPRERLLTTDPVRDAAPGAALVRAALRSGSSDPDARLRARDSIMHLLPVGSGSALDSWRAWFLGTSMLFEDRSEIDAALLELLSLPARHLGDDPALALRAIMISAAVLEAGERTDEAAALRQEIERLEFPVPPALQPKILSTPIPDSGMVSEEETR